MFLWEILDNAAGAVADRTALVSDGQRLTFGDLAAGATALSNRLAELVDPGDRVAVVAENTVGYVAALYGVPRAGGVLVHGNTRHTAAELGAMFEASGATVLLGSDEQLRRLQDTRTPRVRHRACLEDLIGPQPADSATTATTTGTTATATAGAVPTTGSTGFGDQGTAGAVPTTGSAGSTGSGDLETAGVDPEPAPDTTTRPPRTDDSALAWLMYTSGTTGVPKGVMLTHRSVIAAALNTTLARTVPEDEVYLFPFPLFHVAAYNVIHHHLRHRPVVLLAGFDAVGVMAAVETERVTSMSLAPTMVAMVLDHPDREHFDLSSLRNISYGAAAMPRDLLHRCLDELPGVGLSQGYGMTELSGNAVFLSPEDHRLAATRDPKLLTAAGRAGPMTALRIVDERGSDVPAGSEGEILVRGDQVCAGYFGDETATAAAIVDGWLHTGDVGRIDGHGYLHVVDRLKDIIITGGENVSSREVEDAVGTHPAVQAVAVLGIPEDRWGEVVTAVVVPTGEGMAPSVAELREVCSHLAGFKHPRRVVHTEALPTNASGKVDKVALRAMITPARDG